MATDDSITFFRSFLFFISFANRAVPSGVNNPDHTCFILQNGALHPIAQALLQTPAEALSNATSTRAQTPKLITNSTTANDKATNNSNHVESVRPGKRKEGPSRYHRIQIFGLVFSFYVFYCFSFL